LIEFPLRKDSYLETLRNEQKLSKVGIMESTITSQTADPGLRERKKLETKQALALAAVRLAIERGLENVRVQDIADAVNVSRRTFTNYFSSKEEAIASLSTGRLDRATEALANRPTDEPLAGSLAEVFAAEHEAATQLDRERVVPIRMLMTSPALFGEYLKTQVEAEEPLAMVIAERTGADPQGDLYPHVLAAAVIAVVRAATGHWAATGGTSSLPDLIRQAIRQVAGPPPGGTPVPAPIPSITAPSPNLR
jgi:AcrR family transcriptional regulator